MLGLEVAYGMNNFAVLMSHHDYIGHLDDYNLDDDDHHGDDDDSCGMILMVLSWFHLHRVYGLTPIVEDCWCCAQSRYFLLIQVDLDQ